MKLALCGVLVAAMAGASAVSAIAMGQFGPQNNEARERDYRQMLDQLGIQSIRPGPSGDPNAPNAANRDEARATPFPDLPDPLVTNDGRKVTTAEQWWTLRRPEIVELFDREIYGRVPAVTPSVTWAVTATTPGEIGGIKTITKRLIGHVDNSSHPAVKVEIHAALTTPAEATGPVPVMVEFGFTLGARRPTTRGTTQPTQPAPPPGPNWQELVLRKGWGFAILTPTSIQADSGAGLREGIIGLCNKGQPRKPDDWGALRAWAWGASRLLDYLETDPAVDAKQVGIEGLSRYGKAAIVAMAYEPRFAIGFIGSSGQGGVKIMRRDFGERVENVASSGEYHWMAGNYIKYAGPLTVKDLPIDAHELVALCAPRPVFISVGSLNVEGGWIDAVGNFQGGAYASPVYELLGKKGLGTTECPPEGTALLDGEIAYRQHEGGHTTGPNWPTFLDWAGRYIGVKK